MKAFGVVLIVVGILMLVVPRISFTKKEKVVDLGPVEVNKTEKKSIGWPVYAGGVAVVAGLIVLATSSRKNS